MRGAAFIKMHGLGNDFVVLDVRQHALAIDGAAARAIADRHRGVGCDQLVLIEPPHRDGTAAFMRIRNADGGEAEACGNAARCVAALLMRESGVRAVTIDTAAGPVAAQAGGGGGVTVDMGMPRLEWRDIPLARAADTLHVPLAAGPLGDPVCTSMGNPHATFFVADAEAVDLAALGPGLEHDPLFPERANIGVAQVLAPDRIRLRVWERGAGITPACGTGACAALVAAHRRGLTGRRAAVRADGGTLAIEWRDDGHVMMTGPVAVSFRGTLDPSLLGT
ncbi:MAG TPA: diaminopimelate epimerase [Stellaceae bacterium]|nr:diaminopimelate epimerase [Stellaceae bacterium]